MPEKKKRSWAGGFRSFIAGRRAVAVIQSATIADGATGQYGETCWRSISGRLVK